VANKNTSFKLDVNITGSTATVRLSHEGDASLAPATTAQATLGLNIQLTEVDLRQPTGRSAPPSAPPVPGEEAEGTADLIVAPPGVLPWLDKPRGELEIVMPPPPGVLSDFEESIRAKKQEIRGVILDPDDPSQVIGYRLPATAGVTILTDREGNIAHMSEIGIETPLIDPIDFIPTPGTAGKVATGIGGRLAAKVGIKAASKKAATGGLKVGLGVIAHMRGVSRALAGRGLRKLLAESPAFVRRITEAGLNHSFDRHAAEWFGRAVARDTHYAVWRELIERVAASKQVFRWSTGPASTIAHLGQVEGKWFVVQFYEETGELATAFIPNSSQLEAMLRILKGAK
jgi:hypothetical protein